MNDREEWRERVRDIRASGTTWWWWNLFLCQQLKISSLHLFNFYQVTLNVMILIFLIFFNDYCWNLQSLIWQLSEEVGCFYQIFHLGHPSSHHHHIALVARISLTLSRHSFLSFIALGRSSGQHPVSSHSCWMYVRAGRPVFARPCVGVHKSKSLMSSSLLLRQCPACLVRLTWIVFMIGGRWPYNWCLVGCCRQDLFKIARSILV